jgi:hypothetical protein
VPGPNAREYCLADGDCVSLRQTSTCCEMVCTSHALEHTLTDEQKKLWVDLYKTTAPNTCCGTCREILAVESAIKALQAAKASLEDRRSENTVEDALSELCEAFGFEYGACEFALAKVPA